MATTIALNDLGLVTVLGMTSSASTLGNRMGLDSFLIPVGQLASDGGGNGAIGHDNEIPPYRTNSTESRSTKYTLK